MEETDTNKDDEKYSYFNLLCYAFFSIPICMVYSSAAVFTTKFLLDEVKLTPNNVSIVLIVSKGIDAVTDPVFGYFIHNSKITKYGKMKPWVISGIPLLCLSYFLMWYIPHSFNKIELVIWYAVWEAVFFSLLAGTRIPYMSMVMYLTSSTKKRELSTVFRMTFETIGVVCAILVENVLLNQIQSQCEVPFSNQTLTNQTMDFTFHAHHKTFFERQRYLLPALIFIAVLIVAWILFILFVREDTSLIVEREASEGDAKENFNLLVKEVKLIHTFKPFLLLTIIGVCSMMSPQIIEAYLQLFFEYSFVSAKDFFPIISTGIMALAIVYAPLWNFLMRKYGKAKCLIIGSLFILPMFVSIFFVNTREHAYVFCILAILGANSLTVWTIIPFSMLPECIDKFREKHGVQPDTLFFTFFGFTPKTIITIYLALTQLILSASGYLSNICSEFQPSPVNITIRYIFAPMPILCILILCVIPKFYLNSIKRVNIKESIKFTEINQNQN